MDQFSAPIPNQRGVADDVIVSFAHSESNAECAKRCVAIRNCRAFSRSAKSNRCRLFSAGEGAELLDTGSMVAMQHFILRGTCHQATVQPDTAIATATATTAKSTSTTSGTRLQDRLVYDAFYGRTMYCDRPEFIELGPVPQPLTTSTTLISLAARVRVRAYRDDVTLVATLSFNSIPYASAAVLLDGGLETVTLPIASHSQILGQHY